MEICQLQNFDGCINPQLWHKTQRRHSHQWTRAGMEIQGQGEELRTPQSFQTGCESCCSSHLKVSTQLNLVKKCKTSPHWSTSSTGLGYLVFFKHLFKSYTGHINSQLISKNNQQELFKHIYIILAIKNTSVTKKMWQFTANDEKSQDPSARSRKSGNLICNSDLLWFGRKM